jgi:hypothetical protein
MGAPHEEMLPVWGEVGHEVLARVGHFLDDLVGLALVQRYVELESEDDEVSNHGQLRAIATMMAVMQMISMFWSKKSQRFTIGSPRVSELHQPCPLRENYNIISLVETLEVTY